MLKEISVARKSYVKLNEREAKYIQVLHSVGLRKNEIAKEFNYKYMDVINVLRGHAFNHITGIMHINVPADKILKVSTLLQKEIAYREVADMTGVEANQVRIILGYLKYLGQM